MDLQTLVIALLAAWRITHAIAGGEKAGRPFRKLLAGERKDTAGLWTYNTTLLAELTMCFMCLSFWVGILCTVMAVIYPLFLYPFALSALVIFVQEVYTHG